MDSISLSNSMEKGSILENAFSIYRAYADDEASRRQGIAAASSISEEKLSKGEKLLGVYRVDSAEIRGGMGSVWKVHHTGWNMDLALKRPQPRFFAEAGPGRKKDFIEECERWIRLGLHPNIVSCYYVREIGGVPGIFSEWMENGSLKDRIRDKSLYLGTEKEQQRRILHIALGAVYGLRYAHLSGLVHQDIKPGNLLLSADHSVKIADFGLARAYKSMGSGNGEASAGYTLAYCPSEQAQGAEAAPWMDLYAWALTVIEMYSGARTWTEGAEAGSSPEAAGSLIDKCSLPVPDGIKRVLLRCLAQNPDTARNFLLLRDVAEPLRKEYRNMTGTEYPVPPETASLDNADSLNNRALSFLDLGMQENVNDLWDLAFQADQDHFDSFFNRELFAVRSGRKYDYEAIYTLRKNPLAVKLGLDLELINECGGVYSKEDLKPSDTCRTEGMNTFTVRGSADCVEIRNDRIWMALFEEGKTRKLAGLACVDRKTGETISLDPLDAIREKEDLQRMKRTPLEKYVMRDSPPSSNVMTKCISPEAGLAIFNVADEYVLYDMNRRKILRILDMFPETASVSMHVSPDGRILAVAGEYGGNIIFTSHPEDYVEEPGKDGSKNRKGFFTVLYSLPHMTQLLEKNLRFLCFAGRDSVLLSSVPLTEPRRIGPGNSRFSKISRAQTGTDGHGALYIWHMDHGKGKKAGRKKRLQEAYRFDRRVLSERIHTSSDWIMLFQDSVLNYYALDSRFEKIPIHSGLYAQAEYICRYDQETEQLFTGCGNNYIRTAVWNLRGGFCQYTVPGPGERRLWWDHDMHGFLSAREESDFDEGEGYVKTRWSFQPLYSRRETKPASYRISRILTTDMRSEDERRMKDLLRDFENAFDAPDGPDMKKALDCYEKLGEIEGFAISPELRKMEAALEYTAVRSGIRAGVPTGVLQERPPIENRYGMIDRCVEKRGDPLSYLEDHRGKRIVFFRDPDIRTGEVPLPSDVQMAVVRKGRIYAFTKQMACEAGTLEGKPLGAGMILQGRTEDRHETTSFLVRDLDSRAEHVLLSVYDFKCPQARGCFQLDLMDLTLTRLTEGSHSGACYLQDDTIVAAENGRLVCMDPETCSITYISEQPPDKDVLGVIPSQERDRVFISVSGKVLLYDASLRRIGSCPAAGNILPGGRFVQSKENIWDAETGKIVWTCTMPTAYAGQQSHSGGYREISARPDGREVYAQTEEVRKQGNFHVYRLIYDYAPKTGFEKKNEGPEKNRNDPARTGHLWFFQKFSPERRRCEEANAELAQMRGRHRTEDKMSEKMLSDPEYKPKERSNLVKTEVDLRTVDPSRVLRNLKDLDLGDGKPRMTCTVLITDVIDYQENRKVMDELFRINQELGESGRLAGKLHTIPPSMEILSEGPDKHTCLKSIAVFVKVLAKEGLLLL